MSRQHGSSSERPARVRRRVWLWLFLLAVPSAAWGQFSLSNLRVRQIAASLPWQILDSLSIATPLLSVRDVRTGLDIPASLFEVHNQALRVDTAGLRRFCPDCDSLELRYRVLPVNLAAPVSRLDTALIRRAGRDDAIEFDFTPYAAPEPLLGAGGITSSGAYTRGFSIGNSQNLVFNSNLNLQMEGRLGNDLELRAALADNTVPLQPDGSTRQLNEFDRVYIQLRRKNAALTAGDYDLTRPQGAYFSNYFKRLQGAMLEHRHSSAPGDTLSLRAAAAVSRGKFARQIILGQEANQGPYRLQGASGERFIIVLAGTEKVFIDGQLLRRGLTDDYVIDYNLGEVVFTQRRLITKDSRIIVEFEYAVQTYLRATSAADVEWRTRKFRAYAHLYSEQDSRNAGGAQEGKEAERQALAQAGDALQMAFASGVDTIQNGFDPARVQYKLADTVVCGQIRQVLVYTINPDSARFTARFSEVPMGEGNYVSTQTAANGRVYRWVAPDPITCKPQGNFEPIVRLLAPESRQLYSVGGVLQPAEQTTLSGEISMSRRDLNRFSPLDSGDDVGLAGWGEWKQQLFEAKGWKAQGYGAYEFANQFYQPLNPYRPAEYLRDWNLDAGSNEGRASEHIGRGGIQLQKKGWGALRYDLMTFVREQRYSGVRHTGRVDVERGPWKAYFEGNLLASDGILENTRFSRPKAELTRSFFLKNNSGAKQPFLQVGFYGEREKNARGADTLNRAAFWYDLGKLYFKTPAEFKRWQWGGSLTQRNDYFPVGQAFKQNTRAREANLNGKWTKTASAATNTGTQQLEWNLSWRNLQIVRPELTNQKAQETYLGRVDYNLTALKNALTLTTGYEVGSGQSPRLEYNYLLVNPGEGQYTWVDRNRDSILQVDEMEIAVFLDQANYVRVAVTTPDYIRTNNTVFNQNFRLDPRARWGQSANRWKKMLSKASLQSTLQINRRVLEGAGNAVAPWNPFDLQIPDSALVSVNASLRNVLFINRANPAWDFSIAQTDNRGRLQVTTGFESRQTADWTLRARANLGKQWSLEADVTDGQKNSDAEIFNSRDFQIRYLQAGPKITWLPSRSARLSAGLTRRNSQNRLPTAETATQNALSAELTWNPAAQPNEAGFRAATSVRLKLTLSEIQYTGAPNSAVAYNMLEGLQNGQNYLWNLQLDRQLSQTLQISLNYEGRKTGDARTVHVGRAQVRAAF